MKRPARFLTLFLVIWMLVPLILSPSSLASDDPEPDPSASDEILSEDGGEDDAFTPALISVASVGEDDNDALFAAYTEMLFSDAPAAAEAPAFDGESAGFRLIGQDRNIYLVLRDEIISVAEGARTKTVFEITPEQLFGTSDWTLSDLQSVSFDIGKIMACLLADLPYHLYWYDKVQGYSYTNGFAYYFRGEDIIISNNITISLSVSAGYGYQYTTNAAGGSARAAAENAKRVVAQCASLNDYEKLCAYKDIICAYASYNKNVSSESMSYGDPWQLTWVFDNDPETAVVCEGYAKAFQYLCDLSTFSSPLIACVTVSGSASVGDRTSDHMWNIVTMDDGNNYLVDLTNCDEGMVGAPDYLFLKGWSDCSGSGYSFSCSENEIHYAYSSDIKRIYSASDLALSETSYEAAYSESGDVNGSGSADELDAAALLRILSAVSEIKSPAADVDGSGAADELDAALILQYTVSLIDRFPEQDTAPSPQPDTPEELNTAPAVDPSDGEDNEYGA